LIYKGRDYGDPWLAKEPERISSHMRYKIRTMKFKLGELEGGGSTSFGRMRRWKAGGGGLGPPLWARNIKRS